MFSVTQKEVCSPEHGKVCIELLDTFRVTLEKLALQEKIAPPKSALLNWWYTASESKSYNSGVSAAIHTNFDYREKQTACKDRRSCQKTDTVSHLFYSTFFQWCETHLLLAMYEYQGYCFHQSVGTFSGHCRSQHFMREDSNSASSRYFNLRRGMLLLLR